MRGRGSMRGSMRGRQTNTALMRTAFVGRERTNAARRLQRDYAELINATEPLVGVSAKPTSDDMFTWHGNLQGPAGTKWAKGVFHF